MTVQHDRGDGLHEVDLALPRSVHLCALMPAIVELTQGAATPATGTGWRLLQVDGQPLDETMTLAENEVDDGAMLLLTTAVPPAPVWVPGDVSQVAARLTDTDKRPSRLPVAGCVAAAGLVAAAMGWSPTPGPARLVTTAGLTVAAAVAAVVADRADARAGATLSVAAVIFAATTGFVAIPANPGAAHALLSAAAALSVAMVLLRLTQGGSGWLTALATAAVLTAAVTGVAVGWPLPVAAVGASLTVVSLVALSLAPRVAMLVAGVGPSPPDAPTRQTAQVSHAHRVLTGVVVGATGAAVLGCAVIAFGALGTGAAKVGAAAFVAVTAAVLLLRTRTHADPARRTALGAGGIVAAAPCFAIAVAAAPGQVHWLSLLAAVAGAAALSRLIGVPVGPAMQRFLDVTEYLAVAAVVPLGCWVGGVYGAVRTMGLS